MKYELASLGPLRAVRVQGARSAVAEVYRFWIAGVASTSRRSNRDAQQVRVDDVAAADHAEGPAGEGRVVFGGHVEEGGGDVVGHGVGVAAGGGAVGDAGRVEPVHVEVVGADGGRGDVAYGCAL